MGIDAAGALLLFAARAAGVDFRTTATLGRQELHAKPTRLDPAARMLGLAGGGAGLVERCGASGDRYLELLGAESVTSLDASDFEGATLVHDLNMPLPQAHHNAFSAVIDGGTLEHVFNVKQAYTNALNMVAVGGHFLSITCGNNFCGHGFYQFSPEFFFELLTPANGYETVTVLACVSESDPPEFHAVAPPRAYKRRVNLVNDEITYIMAIGKRIAVAPVLEHDLQQSDYANAWSDPTNPHGVRRGPTRKTRFKEMVRKSIPRPVFREMYRRYMLRKNGFGQACYAKLSMDDLATGRLQHPQYAPSAAH